MRQGHLGQDTSRRAEAWASMLLDQATIALHAEWGGLGHKINGSFEPILTDAAPQTNDRSFVFTLHRAHDFRRASSR